MTKSQLLSLLPKFNRTLGAINNVYQLKTQEQLKDKQVRNALAKVAPSCRSSDFVALWDTTLFNSGKDGFLLAVDGLYSPMFGMFQSSTKDTFLPFKNLRTVEAHDAKHTYLSVGYSDGRKEVVYASVYGDGVLALLQEIIKANTPAPVQNSLQADQKKQPQKEQAKQDKKIPTPEPGKRTIDSLIKSDSITEEKYSFLSQLSRKCLRNLPPPDFAKQIRVSKDVPEEHANVPGGDSYCKAVELMNGNVSDSDIDTILHLLEKASDMGHVVAMNTMGILMLEAGSDAMKRQAVKLFKKAADAQYATAALNLGWCYEQGIGTEKNMDLATLHYLAASREGNGDASMRLARCYALGDYVSQDEKLAWSFVLKAAETRNQTAALMIGRMLAEGRNPGVDAKAVTGSLFMTFVSPAPGEPVLDPEIPNDLQAAKFLLAILVDCYKTRDLELGGLIALLLAEKAPELSAEYLKKIAEMKKD